jgi:hypothetical protein
MYQKILSKSSYLTGLQCPKLLWVKIHEKERLPKIDPSKQAIFDNGHIIGELAKKLFPHGINISDNNFSENLRKTKELISKRAPLFEPAFLINRLYARADILVPVEDNKWDIYEVKSSTKVKDVNIHDVSFQKHVYELSGLNIRKSFIVHINNQFVLDTQIIPEDFFHVTDITEKVEDFSKNIKETIQNLLNIIDNKEPLNTIGVHCTSPYDCDIKHECWKHPEGNIFELYLDTQRGFELFERGIIRLKDIPEDYELTTKQFIQRACDIEQKTHTNQTEVKTFLERLEYPIYYLDFETINPVVPKFKRMRPYQRIPFQYSLHMQESKNSSCKHISFLHKTTNDPRKEFLESLKNNLSDKGTILVYNQSFEKSVLRECTEAYPEFQEWLQTITPRIIDLLEPFRNFHYYSPKQKGSASIKKILPVFSSRDYNSLEIGQGIIANLKYEKAIFGNIPNEEQEKTFKALELYCEQDTYAEVEIVRGLYKEVENQ